MENYFELKAMLMELVSITVDPAQMDQFMARVKRRAEILEHLEEEEQERGEAAQQQP